MSDSPSGLPPRAEVSITGSSSRAELAGLPFRFEGVHQVFEAEDSRVVALEQIDMDVQAGEFVSILGPSGCGKSTLLLIAAGLLSPTAGFVTIGDRKVTEPFTDCGFVFQDPTLLDWRSALSNVLIQAEVRKLDRKQAEETARDLMARTGLQGFEEAYPRQLSGGMRQRVAISRALLHDPPVLFMDEPFGALDALTRQQMVLDTQRLWLEGRKTVLFVTHDIGEAIFLSDRIVVMSPRPGRIIETIKVEIARPRTLEALDSNRFVELERHIRHLFERIGIFHE